MDCVLAILHCLSLDECIYDTKMGRSRKSIEVPDVLVAEILSWLPAASLLRFKSVCKHWKSLIEEPEFIARHHQRGDGTTYFLVHSNNLRQYLIPTRDRVMRYNTFPLLADATKVDLTDQLPGYRFHIFRPHNGIFFVQNISYRGGMYLWNPTIKELMALPQSEIKIPDHNDKVVWRRDAGFRFDSEANDYRVVVIHHPDYVDDAPSECLCFAEIYSLRSDSWREIDPGHALKSRTFGWYSGNCNWNLHIDGMYFWLLFDNGCMQILSFDFTVEAFTITSVPPDASRNLLQLSIYEPLDYFFVLNGCIALINPLPFEGLDFRNYEIWALNELGNEESWTKLYKFETHPNSVLGLPWGNLKEDELFVKSECGELELCPRLDPSRMRLLQSIDGLKYTSIAYGYKESLFQLKRELKEDKIISRFVARLP